MDEVLELLLDLNATDEQFESPTLFCSRPQGTASYSPDVPGTDLIPSLRLFSTISPTPRRCGGSFQMLVSSIDYNEFVGRIAIGRIERAQSGRTRRSPCATTTTPTPRPRRPRR